jgi:hypothetical protein
VACSAITAHAITVLSDPGCPSRESVELSSIKAVEQAWLARMLLAQLPHLLRELGRTSVPARQPSEIHE